ncbi:MAG: DUF6152 family protein [Pseudomonadales bacterium]|jgi:hypothetical protein|nr:hypothetical protein [Gammaproteobacteria bacterium]MDP6026235.1 DUF6152 family protein [Pseudomonadales bacterium]MDP7451298.1 DUF6152 family protein [Arenicellales bacterium]MDP6317211.1 DUF6152 family protein [Pseudomonadales bacterium]MDP7314130.1 DUF6152 family protein [Pseudomonadales bacterium]|tara:strand:+ start:626 stop:1063 length:438 start_codon:yes stop_codon:yes gene_type:complete
MIRSIGFGWLMVLLVTWPAAVYGHHAFSSEFDADRPFKVKGEVVKVEWINPHCWIHVDVTTEDGQKEAWMMEAGTPNTLLRAGLTKKLLTVGTEVIVRGYQSKDADCDPKCYGAGRDIRLGDGSRVFIGSTGTGAPKDGTNPSEQ